MEVIEVGGLIASSTLVRSEATYICIHKGIITEIGAGKFPGDRVSNTIFSYPNHLVMPGLINCHGHAAMTLLRGAADDLPLMDWLTKTVFPIEDRLTEDAVYWGTQLAAWEMIRSGTTCYTDMYMFMHEAAQAVLESGIRGVLSTGMVGMTSADRERCTRLSKEFIGAWNGQGDGRIQTILGPHAPYTCPPEYLEEVVALSDELDVPIQIHLSETRSEIEASLRDFGRSPIAHAASLGLFNRRLLAAHCVHVDEEDIRLMAEHAIHVAHNPQSNLKLGSGVAPLKAMQDAGILVGLGTDGAASNNNLDMFEEMRLAATLHKGVLQDPTAIPAATAFRMATEDGAKALFQGESFGTVEVGQSADLVFLSLDSPHFHPSLDLISNVVYAAGADDVTDVMVQGKFLLKAGEPKTIDIEKLYAEVQRISSSLYS